MIILIDNYDSFSYNLYQMIGIIEPDILTIRNDEMSVDDIKKLAPDAIVISPGPGKPASAGICVEVIKELYKEVPILGICLGHQAIYEAFGGIVSNSKKIMHGKSSEVTIDICNPLFKTLSKNIHVARYHSLIGIKETLPEPLEITAWTKKGEIMAVCHKEYPIYGVQFHPESILTPNGKTIVENFLGGH